MFLLKIHNKNNNTKNNIKKKRNLCFIYIKTRIKKYIFRHNGRKTLKKNVFVLCFFLLQKQCCLFSKKGKKTSIFSIKKGTDQVVLCVPVFKFKHFFETMFFLIFMIPINTCFLIDLYNIFNINKGKNQCFI